MEKHLVLIKFFGVSEQIRATRHNLSQQNNEELPLQQKYKLPPSGCNMLVTLMENGSLNQRAIANIMNISSQAVSETIKKLETKELIVKENGTHNNEKIITLTETGANVAQKLDEGVKKHAKIIFENFSNEEIDTLYNLLDKLAK
ncbi:MAG: MarR family transcriptional regulator [Clostridia bacterium]